MRRLQGVEDLLPAVDVLTGSGELVLVDQGVLPLALHVRDAVRRTEDEVAVDDREVVTVQRANRRSRDAVAFDVVLAAVAWTAVTAGGNRRDHRDPLALREVDVLLLVVLYRAVRLDGATEVRATVRNDREARLAVQLTVVADVCGPVRHLASFRVHEELRHEPLPGGEVVQRAQVDLRIPLPLERRHDHEADRGHGHETADHGAQSERRALEEPIAWEALAGLDLGRCRLTTIGRAGLARAAALRLDR